MNEQNGKLIQAFETFEKARGIKDTKRILPHLKPLFRYLELRDLPVSELKVRSAQEFQTHLATLEDEPGKPHYAALTVKSYMSMAARFYAFLKNEKQVFSNPFLSVKRIRAERKLPRAVSTEPVMCAMLESLSRFWEHRQVRQRRMYYKTHVVAELMYASGMRMGEVLKLKAGDVDFEAKTVLVRGGKGGKDRIAFLNEYSSRVLKLYVETMRDLVNSNREDDTIFGIKSQATVGAVFHRNLSAAAVQYGLSRFTSHAFRHTLGFHLLRRGCDLRYIQLILGHEDMNTTTIYTKVDKLDLRNELDRCHPRSRLVKTSARKG
jgi:site-specific recombinase XerD